MDGILPISHLSPRPLLLVALPHLFQTAFYPPLLLVLFVTPRLAWASRARAGLKSLPVGPMLLPSAPRPLLSCVPQRRSSRLNKAKQGGGE